MVIVDSLHVLAIVFVIRQENIIQLFYWFLRVIVSGMDSLKKSRTHGKEIRIFRIEFWRQTSLDSIPWPIIIYAGVTGLRSGFFLPFVIYVVRVEQVLFLSLQTFGRRLRVGQKIGVGGGTLYSGRNGVAGYIDDLMEAGWVWATATSSRLPETRSRKWR